MRKELLYKLNKIIKKNYKHNNFALNACLSSINIIKKKSEKEKNLSDFLNSNLFFFKVIFLFFLNLSKFISNIFLLFIFIFYKPIINNDNKVLFISHSFGKKNEDDNYFKYFKDIYKKKSVKFFSYNIVHSKFNFDKYKNNLYFLDLLKISSKIFVNFVLWIFVPFFEKINIRIYLFTLINIISTPTLNNYRIVYEVLRVLERSKNIDRLYYTFEGHFYETFLIHQIKKIHKKNINLFAYQHTGLSENNNSIYFQNFKESKPDTILCINNHDQKFLKIRFKIKKTINIGRYNKIKNTKKWKVLDKLINKKQINFLILLDDNVNEIKNFIQNISNNKKVSFTIRCHPEKKFQLNYFKNINFVKFSKSESYLDDFERNDIIIYSYSSLSLEAIQHGLLPITLKKQKKNSLINKLNAKNLDDVYFILNNLHRFVYKKYIKYALTKSSYFNKNLFIKIINE